MMFQILFQNGTRPCNGIRTLQYYDKIGLLHPTEYTESGYRLYDDADLEKLQQILLFRELEFPLKEIQRIISRPNFDKNKALEQQITLLELKKERLVNLICIIPQQYFALPQAAAKTV